jgi:hypothetical protein
VGLASEEGQCLASSNYDDTTMGDLTAEDMILLGAFAPTLRSSLGLTLEMAASDFNSQRDEVIPPVLVVACDDSPGTVELGMFHLTEELGVRAIVASLEDTALRAAVMSVDPVEGPVFISPNGPVSEPESFSGRAELVWYLRPRAADAAAAYASVVQQAMTAIAARGAPTEVSFAAIIGAAPEDRALEAAVRNAIAVGGVPITNPFYQTFELRDDSAAERAAQMAQLAHLGPDIVLVFAGGTFSDLGRRPRASVAHELEAATGPEWQPLYVFGPRNTEDDTLRRLAAASPSFRARAFGVDWSAPLLPSALAVVSRFRERYPLAVAPETNLDVMFDAFDAFHFLAFAELATLDELGRGQSNEVLRGLRRVTRAGAEVVSVDSSGLARLTELLRAGMDLDWSGTRGVAAFQPESHARSGSARLYCWNPGGALLDLARFNAGQLAPTDVDCAEQLLLRSSLAK